jgi:hypothetical protein
MEFAFLKRMKVQRNAKVLGHGKLRQQVKQ